MDEREESAKGERKRVREGEIERGEMDERDREMER